jgi:hypothetical protein
MEMTDSKVGLATGPVLQALTSALLFGGVFGAFAFAIHLASPLRIVLGSLAMAVLGGITGYRLSLGRSILPTAALVVLAVGALALYTAALVLGDRPAGSEWAAVVVVFAIPIAILAMAYRQWKEGR